MSFTVLVIPEDPLLNGHILKPLTEAIVADAGRSSAKVHVLTNPRLRGYHQAVKTVRDELPGQYRFMDLWLFFPDADRACRAGSKAMQKLETDVAAKGITLLCCAAQPEVEIYACAAFRKDIPSTWEEARDHPRMKEEIFEPLLKKHGDPRRADRGRDLMTRKSLENLPLLFRLCPELQCLRDRIGTHLQAN